MEGVKRDTFMEHKEVVVVCEQNGPINMSHNALLITPKMNVVNQTYCTYWFNKINYNMY